MTVEEHADALWAAERDRTPIAPLTESDPGLTIADAYAIQRHNIDRRIGDGAVIRGRKVGLSSKAMQELLGVNEPDYGVLLHDMFVEEGDSVAADAMLFPRIEAEIAFVMATDLRGPGATTATAMRAIAGAMPSLEIVDSRIKDWRITLIDTVADNASSARVALGGRITPLDGLDLRTVGMLMSRNGEVVESGAGAAVLGHPARCVAWLANKLAEFGDAISAGDVILPGALHRAVNVAPGDVFTAEFSHLGAVTARFS